LFLTIKQWNQASGVDVMITIFDDFRPLSAIKLALFSQTNITIKFLHYFALFRVKSANFYSENLLKIKTSAPGERSLRNVGSRIDAGATSRRRSKKITHSMQRRFLLGGGGANS
jgi:hypothetical protein